MMAGRYDRIGSQGEWPYPGSGPSGSSETLGGVAWLSVHRDAESDLPLGQGEGDARQGAPAPTADELRESLRGIITETHELTAPAAPQTPKDIRAALRDGVGVHEAPAPQAVEEIRADQYREALWSAEGTLRNTPEVLVAAADELESIIKGGNVPVSVVPRLKAVVKSLRAINLHDLGVAQSYVGTEAYKMDMEANNCQ
jgi:hypothetical protein